MPEPPPLTVLIPTTQPWPEIEAPLRAVYAEAVELGAEILLLASSEDGFPPDMDRLYPAATTVVEPGASVFRLRSVGLARARGEVVAATEDHAIPRPGWCAAHLRAHGEHPDVAVVGGPIDNASRASVVDWAIFLRNHAPFVPPAGGSGPRSSVDRANASYKRRVLPHEPSPDGRSEPFIDERLRARGERFYLDERILSDHRQSFGLAATLAMVYHNGRAVSGFRVAEGIAPRERAVRITKALAKAPVFFAQTAFHVVRQRRSLPPRALASLPLVAAVTTSISVGSLVGYVRGPGRSPHRLR